MARAALSERIPLKRTAAIISERLPRPVPVSPSPFGRSFDVVFVGSRSGLSSRKLLGYELLTDITNTSTRTLKIHSPLIPDYSKQHERNMKRTLNKLFLMGHSGRNFLEFCLKSQGYSISSSHISTPCARYTQTQVPTSHSSTSAVMSLAYVPLPLSNDMSMLRFDTSRGMINQMQASLSPSSQDSQEPTDPDKPTPVQLSFILDKLREELPAFFDQPHTYSMYSPNMVFTNRLVPFAQRLYGRDAYQSILAFFKSTLTLFCSNVKLEVLRIAKDPFEGKVTARWRIVGRPLIRKEERVILDGFSEFIVNTEGLIAEHKIDKVTPSKHHNLARSFLRRRLEALLPNKQTTPVNSQNSVTITAARPAIQP